MCQHSLQSPCYTAKKTQLKFSSAQHNPLKHPGTPECIYRYEVPCETPLVLSGLVWVRFSPSGRRASPGYGRSHAARASCGFCKCRLGSPTTSPAKKKKKALRAAESAGIRPRNQSPEHGKAQQNGTAQPTKSAAQHLKHNTSSLKVQHSIAKSTAQHHLKHGTAWYKAQHNVQRTTQPHKKHSTAQQG